jgi:hypothetical protein
MENFIVTDEESIQVQQNDFESMPADLLIENLERLRTWYNISDEDGIKVYCSTESIACEFQRYLREKYKGE